LLVSAALLTALLSPPDQLVGTNCTCDDEEGQPCPGERPWRASDTSPTIIALVVIITSVVIIALVVAILRKDGRHIGET
jgi:hypothetical protein